MQLTLFSVTRLFLLATVFFLLSPSNGFGKNIGIAFIEDPIDNTDPGLPSLIVQELSPLLRPGDKVVPLVLRANTASKTATKLMANAFRNRQIDIVVATGFIASQELYRTRRFSKPTYLLRVLDPALSGGQPRQRTRNLRSYSTVNEIGDVFDRLTNLFGARKVGILLPSTSIGIRRNLGRAIKSLAQKYEVETQFLSLDFEKSLSGQIPATDAVVLPPVFNTDKDRDKLLAFLRRERIPSYAVGGEQLVLAGALISDELRQDERQLARRVALDLQLAISGESATRGFRRLQARKRTTINVDTARAIGVDFSLDEVMTARIVRGSGGQAPLAFLPAILLASDRNLDLQRQNAQLRIDKESLAQARAIRRPQVAAQLDHTRRGESLPSSSSVASISLSQSIYSPSANERIKIASLGLGASEQTLRQTRIDTTQKAATAYFDALQTQTQFDSALRNLVLNRENLSLAQRRKRSGSGTGAEIYRWQSIIASSESDVLRAYSSNAAAQNQLAQVINKQFPVPAALADVSLKQPPFDLLHEGIEPYLRSTAKAERLRQACADRAMAQSPQLKSAIANVAISRARQQSLSRSYYTPEFSVAGQVFQYPSDAVGATGMPIGYRSDWAVTLTAKLPLWQGGSRSSQSRQYAAEQAQAQAQVNSIRMALWANASDVVNSLVANFRSIKLSKEAEQAARKSQQITQRSYNLGSASVTDVLDTQNEYRQAQDNVHVSRYQYMNALVNFQALIGEMPMLRSGAEQRQWLREFTGKM